MLQSFKLADSNAKGIRVNRKKGRKKIPAREPAGSAKKRAWRAQRPRKGRGRRGGFLLGLKIAARVSAAGALCAAGRAARLAFFFVGGGVTPLSPPSFEPALEAGSEYGFSFGFKAKGESLSALQLLFSLKRAFSFLASFLAF